MIRYSLALLAALGGYSAPLWLGAAALHHGAPLLAAVAAWGGVAAVVILVLAFSVPPLPAHPRTLREMDFAAIAWLPHAAVTRLPEGPLRHRARLRVFQRLAFAGGLLVLQPLCLGAALAAAAHPLLGALAAGAALLGAAVWIGLLGRERLLARGVPPPGTDIG